MLALVIDEDEQIALRALRDIAEAAQLDCPAGAEDEDATIAPRALAGGGEPVDPVVVGGTGGAEQARLAGADAATAARQAGQTRLRAILMTSLAMLAGMVPMALGWSEAGSQTAPLGRAVMGGLIFGTLATLMLVPAAYAWIMGPVGRASLSVDPDDPRSPHFQKDHAVS